MRGSVGSCPYGLLSFLSDVYGLFDPSGKTPWLSVDHRRLRPVDDMVFFSCVVVERGFLIRVINLVFLSSVPLRYVVNTALLKSFSRLSVRLFVCNALQL